MSFVITGIGTATPPRVAIQSEAAELAPRYCRTDDRGARMLRLLYRKSGVEQRHTAAVRGETGPLADRVPYFPIPTDDADRGPTTGERMGWYADEAPGLAHLAAERALAAAETAPDEITHLVTVSCTGFDSPGVDAHLIETLGLSRGVARTHVGFMGCHGALNGLRTAGAYAGADPNARVLVCAVELCSFHFAYGWDEEMLVANTLFADGAAAVVGRGSSPGEPSSAPWAIEAHASFLMPDSTDAMTWSIGDHGFRMTLSAQVPELIGRHLRGWLDSWLAGHGLTTAQVGSWAVHPGGPRILDAVRETLDIDESELVTSRQVLQEYGNMSSPTVLFILERMMRADRPRPCVALAFGPGLVVEAALIK